MCGVKRQKQGLGLVGLELAELRATKVSTVLDVMDVADCVAAKGAHLMWTIEDERKATVELLQAADGGAAAAPLRAACGEAGAPEHAVAAVGLLRAADGDAAAAPPHVVETHCASNERHGYTFLHSKGPVLRRK